MNRGFMEKEVLTIAETASYLKVSEKTIRRLIDDGAIPCAKVGGQWRFMRTMLVYWLQSQMNVVPQQEYINSLLSQKEAISVARLIDPSCVFMNLQPDSPEIILKILSDSMARCGAIADEDLFLEQLMEREKIMPTGIGKGIAIPHPRTSGISPVIRSALAIGFCPQGIDFNSLDGTKTYLFIVIASRTDQVHLRVLTLLTRMAGDDSFLPAVFNMKSPAAFISYLLEKETEILS